MRMNPKICFFGLNNFTSSFDNLNSVSFSVFGDTHSWLLDTGATLSAVKLEHLVSKNIPFHIERVPINGIGGTVYTEGFVYLTLVYNNLTLKHKFYIFKTLPCKTDGILGQDFMNTYKYIINFEQNTLTINEQGNYFDVPLQMGQLGYNNYVVLPPRCEYIHYIDTSIKQDCFVAPKQLSEGIFLGAIIVEPKNNQIPIRILNTRDEEVRLSFFIPELHPLCNFDIYSFIKKQ